ncbi:MAG: archease [bacterium]
MSFGRFYELIEHTADLGIEVTADNLKGIFVNSALALFDLMVGIENIQKVVKRELGVSGRDQTELLVAWLNELLYVYSVEKLVFAGFEDVELRPDSIEVIAYGELFDPEKHEVHIEVKAATYHGLSLSKVDGLWKARIIFDI